MRPEHDRYMGGDCHVLAVAIHRETGWPVVAIQDLDEPFWIYPDGDGFIPAVVHVLCVDPDGNLWDIAGKRGPDRLQAEAEQRWRIGSYHLEDSLDEATLADYVGSWGTDADGGEIDRPLNAYDEADVAQARPAALSLLSDYGFAIGSRP